MADPPTPEESQFSPEALHRWHTYRDALPYPIESNEEIQKLYDLYLTRIVQCVAAKDYDPGFLQWDSMLNYWRMLKYPLPKDKHIAIVKLYYDLAATPGMPLHVVNACVDTLSDLLNSKKKLKIEDMRLPWKPIYNILSKDLFLSRRQFEITQTSNQMAILAEITSRFYHPACTDEMVDIILPSFNALDLNSVLATQYYLNTFLPRSHPTWLPMMMRIWASINSYAFDERHFALLAELAEMHINPTVSDPRHLNEIPDDARVDEMGSEETGPRLRWNHSEEYSHAANGVNGVNGVNGHSSWHGLGIDLKTLHQRNYHGGGDALWQGLFKDVGIFTQEEWDLIMCKCLASMEIPLADGGSFTTGPIVDDQASFEFSRLPKSNWRIYSLAKLIVYSMAPDGKQLPQSGNATPFELPASEGGGYFHIPLPKKEPRYLAGCKALDSLARMIISLESFFHPSNGGDWTTDLSAFLKFIVFEFSKRWNEESKPDCKVPHSRRLTTDIRRELVRSLRTAAFLAMFSTDSGTVTNIQSALKSMTIMEPELIIPPILERSVPSLEALVETHRTLAIIKALGAIAVGIVSRDIYYPGARHLIQILELLLPGIDLNDPLKTVCTTAFLVEISQHIKFSDLTQIEPAAMNEDTQQASWSPQLQKNIKLPQVRLEVNGAPTEEEDEVQQRLPDEEEDALLRDTTAGFANWAAGFIRRVILLLENLPDEEDTSSGTSEANVVSAVAEACSQICLHLSEPLFDLVLDLIYDFATTNVRSNAVRAIHQLVECVTMANPEKTLARFVPFAVRNIRVELEHGASSIRSTSYSHSLPSDTTLHWNIAILRGVLHHGGAAILKYQDECLSILELLHKKTLSKRGFSYTGKLLYSLLESLTNIYTLEMRFVNPAEWKSEEFNQQHYKYWGRLYAAEDVEVPWHVPDADEIDLTMRILTSLVEPALVSLESLVRSKAKRDNIWSNDFCRHLGFVRNAFSGISTLCQDFISDSEMAAAKLASDVLHEIPDMIATVQPVKSGFVLDDPSDPRYQKVLSLKSRFGAFLHEASLSLLKQDDENTVDAVLMLIRSCRTYLLDYADSRYSFNRQMDDYEQELGVNRRYANQKIWPRAIFVRRAQVYHAARMRWNALERRSTPAEDRLIEDLIQWALWQYATVRASAQTLLDALTGAYDGVRKKALPVLYQNLVKGSDDDRMKGALYTLNLSAFGKYAMGEPTLVPELVKHLFGCQWNEKPSIQDVVATLGESCIAGFVEPCYLGYQVDYPATSRSMSSLENILRSAPSKDTLVIKTEKKRLQRQSLQEDALAQTRELLLSVGNSSSTHWKYAIAVIRLLRTMIRRDMGAHPGHLDYILSQTHASHPSIRYYAQRAVMKATRYIKLRTTTSRLEDLALYRNRNPLRRVLPTEHKSHEYTAEYLESFKSLLDESAARDEPLLEDKITSGWLVWKYEDRSLLPDTEKSAYQPWDSASAKAISVIRKHALSRSFWDELSGYFAEENHQEHAIMDNISTVKSIVQIVERDVFDVIRLVIEKLLSDKDQNKQRGAAELLAGLLSGSKNWPTDASERIWTWLTPQLDKILNNNVKTDTLTIWTTFLEYMLSNRDPRRIQPLVDYLVEDGLSPAFNSESSFEPARTTFFTRSVIDTLGWKFTAWVPDYMSVYWPELGGEHDEVTSYIAEALVSFAKLHWRPRPSQPTAEVFMRECSTRPAGDDIMGVEHGYQLPAFLELVDKLPGLREQRLSGANAARSPYDKTLMTVVRWLYRGLQEVNAASMFQYILPVLPELFKAAELLDSDDLAARTQTLLSAFCGVTPPLHVMPELLEIIFATIRTSPSWRIRSNTLPMLQILYFRQAPIISEEYVIRIQDALSECLDDEVVEVREKAATTLSGILRVSPRRTILILKDRFIKQAAEVTLPKRNTPTYATKLRKLHAAILGVTALIDAFPYSIPSWLPELIGDVLSRHTYNPVPIASTVRKCASKFKETHQDTWHEDALKFNEEQTSALATLLAGSSYYA